MMKRKMMDAEIEILEAQTGATDRDVTFNSRNAMKRNPITPAIISGTYLASNSVTSCLLVCRISPTVSVLNGSLKLKRHPIFVNERRINGNSSHK
jgi:hypothetical protein